MFRIYFFGGLFLCGFLWFVRKCKSEIGVLGSKFNCDCFPIRHNGNMEWSIKSSLLFFCGCKVWFCDFIYLFLLWICYRVCLVSGKWEGNWGGFKFEGVFWIQIKYDKEEKKMTIIPIFVSMYEKNWDVSNSPIVLSVYDRN